MYKINIWKMKFTRLQKLQISICWLGIRRSGGRDEDDGQQPVAMAMTNAFSRFLAMLSWIIATAYSIDAASHGNVIGPFPGRPNSSSAILKSSLKISLLRYSRGSTKRLWSALYTTKWPLSAIHDCMLQPRSASSPSVPFGYVILFLLILASVRHFLAILMSFLALTILWSLDVEGNLRVKKKLRRSVVVLDPRQYSLVIYSQGKRQSLRWDFLFAGIFGEQNHVIFNFQAVWEVRCFPTLENHHIKEEWRSIEGRDIYFFLSGGSRTVWAKCWLFFVHNSQRTSWTTRTKITRSVQYPSTSDALPFL